MINRVFRMPGNTLPCEGHIALHRNWGWPWVPTLRVLAAMARATFAVSNRKLCAQLSSLFSSQNTENLPLNQIGNRFDTRWKVPPFAVGLCDLLREDNTSGPEVTCARLLRGPPVPRREIRVAAEIECYRDWVSGAVTRRLSGLEPPSCANEIDFAQVETLRSVIISLPCGWALVATRPLLNGWTTSHRMHDPTRDMCYAGCAAPDTFSHYLCCPEMLRMLDQVSPLPEAAPSGPHSMGLCRAQECTSPLVCVGRLILATGAYQAARSQRRETPGPPDTSALKMLMFNEMREIRQELEATTLFTSAFVPAGVAQRYGPAPAKPARPVSAGARRAARPARV